MKMLRRGLQYHLLSLTIIWRIADMKKTRNTFPLLFIILVLFCHSASDAQVVPPQTQQGSFRQHIFGLGLFGGAASGIGLSFRHHLPMPASYQVTGGIVKTDGKLRSDIGIELQYDLARTDRSRFYVAGGFSYFYSGRDGNNEMEAANRGGIGIGGEWTMDGGLHMLGDVLFTFFGEDICF
jgi:hypothetical protein